MPFNRHHLIGLLLVVLPATASAQIEKPRVLFLGDSVHRQMISAAANELNDSVRIEFPRGVSPSNSGAALKQIDELLGNGEWDLIYFNFGLGDLLHKDPRTKEIRAMSKEVGGVRVTSPDDYQKNLDAIVERLKQTDAMLVWAHTTPIANADSSGLFEAGSAAEYNKVAEKVMVRHEVPVNDIHAYVMAQFKEVDKHPDNLQYLKALQNKSPLHKPVVEVIRKLLGLSEEPH
ncbi:MAG: SGNH/GDSL hydrolase family protein [Planctomycetota bacterium]|nr:SGNH/GDSL hydrolase family protein [Planctomycetota bacterium]MDA1165421.1 SGNH/GDSL hydrolase family protein [Planctomycetota bacterium]